MPRPYDTSSMTALICFEAAGRNLGFKAAAQELNVTPAAISHQIKALELDLGCPLFRRLHRGVELTDRGAFLLVSLQRGFESISDAVKELKRRPDSVDLTVRSTSAVSALWLTGQITRFWRAYPEITVSQIVSDVVGAGSRYDVAVGYGVDDPGRSDLRRIHSDQIIAVGTAQFARDHGIGSLQDLLTAPLIHLNYDQAAWTGWADWFGAFGLTRSTGRNVSVNNHMIALQAAEDHIGAVLGWRGLITNQLRDGRLVQLVPELMASPQSLLLEVPAKASANARLFADWLIGNAATEAGG